ncbi:MAG: Na+/H+ antiporter subunit D [Propionivibrio sp.]|nr:Na+/H+ antiporter subunit D [Propionivibrio sp.]
MLLLSPLLLPLLTALLCALSGNSRRRQHAISLVGALALLVCAGILLMQVAEHGRQSVALGNWPLPFAIEFAADRLSAAMVALAALMLTLTLIWQLSDDRYAPCAPWTPALLPLLHGLVAGACAAFMTADLFNLYVWLELSLICALGLLVQGGALRQLDATLKYFVLNIFGTLLLLTAVGLIYGATGQLNFTALGQAAAQTPASIMLPLLGLLLLAFLIKAAAFPFFAWLPASYHTLPVPILALFSALLTKIGIYALLRLFADVFQPAPTLLFAALGWIALFTMVAGVLGAAYHWDIRRILAFHSISQIGYILLAIALASPAGNAAAIFFALHHSLVKAGLLLTAGLIFRAAGHYDLRRIGGLYATNPGLGAIFMLLALSLVGIPPFSGFWGKYLIVRAALLQGEYLWVATALGVGLLTLYSMLKIWLEAFWKPHPDSHWQPTTMAASPASLCVGALLLITLAIGLFPGPLIAYVTAAADALSPDQAGFVAGVPR